MQRINVVGCSGSGKSTFSKNLSELLSIDYIEIDALHWKDNWQESSDEELFLKLKVALDQEQWVLDGNYTRTIPIKWEKVDTVIWLDYSFGRTFWQSLKRAITRITSQKQIWANLNNRETVARTFFSKDSILLWMVRNYGANRKKLLLIRKNPDYQHINFIRFRNPKQSQDFLNQLRYQKPVQSNE